MSGNRIGGRRCAATNKARYGSDYYARIGAIGGKNGHTGGFAAGEEGRRRASIYGRIGGEKSRRGKSYKNRARADEGAVLVYDRKRGLVASTGA